MLKQLPKNQTEFPKALMKETVRSSETLVHSKNTTRRDNSKDH
jgi:hypothetical protein